MKSFVKSALLLCVFVSMTGCASGPKYAEAIKNIQPLASDQGRVFIYRKSAVGAAVQPAVRLNGETVGNAVPHGFFYVDRPPGQHQIETSTEVKRTLSFGLEPGQTRYVRLNIGMGFFVGHVWPELVENAVGSQEVQKCSYTGPKP